MPKAQAPKSKRRAFVENAPDERIRILARRRRLSALYLAWVDAGRPMKPSE